MELCKKCNGPIKYKGACKCMSKTTKTKVASKPVKKAKNKNGY